MVWYNIRALGHRVVCSNRDKPIWENYNDTENAPVCGSRGVFRLGETPRFDGDKNRETKKPNRYARVGKK